MYMSTCLKKRPMPAQSTRYFLLFHGSSEANSTQPITGMPASTNKAIFLTGCLLGLPAIDENLLPICSC